MAQQEQLPAEVRAFDLTEFVPFPVIAFHRADAIVARYFDAVWQTFGTLMSVLACQTKPSPELPVWRLRKNKRPC